MSRLTLLITFLTMPQKNGICQRSINHLNRFDSTHQISTNPHQ